jgi:GH25 family lysozyme M1 (1,4-beta-N-acetylmuramidase)
MEKIIIDVSQYNGNINWSSVDCDGVFIRIAYRGYTAGTIKQDSKFLTNMKGALSKGIPVGLYFMSQAINEAEAVEEANFAIEQIKSYEVTLPIFYDSELSGEKKNNGRADKLTKSQRTANCLAFCRQIELLGYKSGTYASTSWYKSNLDVSQLLNYFVWVAQYADTCTATHRKDMWQYTSKGSIAGISGFVDISSCYTDLSNSKSATQDDINYIPGTYQLTCNLKVREGAGINYRQKTYSQLTANAKKNATKEGILKASTKVDVSEIIVRGTDIWGKIPSGWIALFYDDESFVVKY